MPISPRPFPRRFTMLLALMALVSLALPACPALVIPGEKDCLAGASFDCTCDDGAKGTAQCTTESVIGACSCTGGTDSTQGDTIADTALEVLDTAPDVPSEVVQPEVGPEVVQPEVGPEVVQPEVVQPDVVEPEVVQPDVADPDTSDTGDGLCVPSCVDKACGPDDCGGHCGICSGGEVCLNFECSCAPAGVTCHEGDLWNTDTCGTYLSVATACANGCSGTTCNACTPQCTGKSCGPDQCGGSCGSCGVGEACSANGGCECSQSGVTGCYQGDRWEFDDCGTALGIVQQCQWGCINDMCSPCVPDCTGKSCGADGCGGSCGTCPVGTSCDASNLCSGPCSGDPIVDQAMPSWDDQLAYPNGIWQSFKPAISGPLVTIESKLNTYNPGGPLTLVMYLYQGVGTSGTPIDTVTMTVDGSGGSAFTAFDFPSSPSVQAGLDYTFEVISAPGYFHANGNPYPGQSSSGNQDFTFRTLVIPCD